MNRAVPKPLRVLQVNSMLTGGGTDDQCARLAHGLHELGQTASVAGPAGRDWARVLADLGVPLADTGTDGPLKLHFIVRIAKVIRNEHIQLVHGHHGRDYWPTVIAARLSGSQPKIVLTRHLAKSPSSLVSRRWLLGQCDAMIAVSQFVAKVLHEGVYEKDSPEPERRARPPLRGNFARIRVIYSGIDTERFRPMDGSVTRQQWGLEAAHSVFAVAGGYDLPRGKGQQEFLAAAARIHHQAPQARFLIIGRGNMSSLLQGQIEQLGLKGKAWLTPYCSDMPQAMNAIDCLVHPVTGTEALGLVVCEATACGKPVIASRLDGIPEAFEAGQFGDLVKPGSVEELAQAMLVWAARPSLPAAQRFRLHQQIVRERSLLAMTEKTLNVYRELLGR
jgi:glycosyltransferase involved in cell wall biosynthesis